MSIRRLAAAVGAASFLALAGCYSAPIMPPPGLLYSGVAAPMSLGPTDLGSRRGEASTKALLGLFAWGDASVKAAASDGGIQQVKHLDYEYTNVLFGIYQSFTTVAHGD